MTALYVLESRDFKSIYLAYLDEFGIQLKSHEDICQVLALLLRRRWVSGFCARTADGLNGFCIYSRSYSPIACSGAYSINDIYVAPAKRRMGIASQMVARLSNQAKNRGVKRIYVNTDASDASMMAFYRHNHFVDGDANTLKLETL